MKIISWNILAFDINIEWRTRQICRLIKENNPDVICLQEVIDESWIIIKDELVINGKYISAYNHPYINNTSIRCYGEVILSKLPILSRGFDVFQSKQGRVYTWIQLQDLTIYTFHLESSIHPSSNILRMEQLRDVKANIHNHTLCIGDFNTETGIFCPEETYHGNRFWNSNENRKYDGLLKSDDIEIKSWVRIGTEKIDDKWLSDHDGVMVEIKRM